MSKSIFYSDIFYYNKDGELKKIKKCSLLNEFVFKRQTFFLTKKSHFFMVCAEKDGELISIWNTENKDAPQGEIMSVFRNIYLEKNITDDMLKMFIDQPVKYNKKYKVIKTTKKKKS